MVLPWCQRNGDIRGTCDRKLSTSSGSKSVQPETEAAKTTICPIRSQVTVHLNTSWPTAITSLYAWRTLSLTSKALGKSQTPLHLVHPLTDHRDEAMLQQYGLKPNDAILAEEKHMGLYEDLLQNRDAKLIAGGAAQNTARGAQVKPDRSPQGSPEPFPDQCTFFSTYSLAAPSCTSAA